MPAPIHEIPGIPHRFRRTELLQEALTHRSLGPRNYERLEFLGDSAFNFIVTRRLFELRPDENEGALSRLRSRVVRGETLAQVARDLQLGDYLKMGEGELRSGGYRRKSVLADCLEAIIGAVYMDGGAEACAGVVHSLFDPIIEALPDAESLKDAKTRLQEWLQAKGRPLPSYALKSESGLDHDKRFEVLCALEDSPIQHTATARSRRRAEQAAAQLVLAQCQEETE